MPDPHAPRPGDVVVALPHTLTRATGDRFVAEARARIPSATSLSPTAVDARLVLDASACAVLDAAGVAAIAGVARTAAAAGVGTVVVGASPEVRALLAPAVARGAPLVLADAPVVLADAPVAAFPPTRAPPPAADPPAGVLPLDDAARVRLARRRRR